VSNSGLGLASFLLGLSSSYSRTITLVEPQEKQWRIAYYGQDTWQVTPKLTLSLGLRWDWASPIFAQDGQHVGNLDLSTGNILLSNLYGKYAGVRTLKNEFSPRLGASYRFQKDSVIRGGYGRSYFLGAAGATFGTQARCWPLKQSQTFSQANSHAPLGFTLDEGPGVIPPAPALPASGQIALPDGIGSTFPGVGTLPHSYMDQWNVTVEHSFPSQVTGSIGYVGDAGRKMWDNVDINAAPPGPGDFNPRRPYYAKYGWTQGLTQRNQVIPGYSDLTSNYNGLQAKVEKRFGTGIWILSNFTWAHCLDYGTFGSEDQAFDRASNYGNCDYVRPWTSISAFNWELPFGRGKALGKDSNALMNAVIGGWTISGLVNLEKGFYSTPYADTSNLNSSDSDLRPNVAGNWKLDHPTREKWFDATAFSQPGPYSYGNARRRSIEKPNFYSTDLSLAKSFSIRESARLELRWDAFNAFNQTNLAGPDNYIPSSTVGQITSIVDFKRRMQIGARLSF
jgi:TonB dependent receptor